MIKCVIFDLDGTLLNTLDDLFESTNFALKQMGFAQRTKQEVRSFVGNGVRKLIERALPCDSEQIITEECLRIFKENYSKSMYNNTKPYNSIEKILQELKLNGVKTGVVSNKFDSAVKELCQRYFGNFIDVAVGQSENILPKPSTDGVFKVIQDLQIKDLSEVVYVGDSDVDIQTAKNANIKSIAVTWGFRDREILSGADFIIDEPYGIIEVIRRL